MSTVLSMKKSEVRRSFSLAAKNYDDFAGLQREVGLALLSKIDLRGIETTVVDIGCGTGFLTQELMMKNHVYNMVAIDLAFSMLQLTKIKLAQRKYNQATNIHYLCADAERLPLLDNSVEKIISNLALQWCPDLSAVFDGFYKSLKGGGEVCLSTFGPATLQELKMSWSKVDDFTHVNKFYSADEVFSILQQAGFKHINIETKHYFSHYHSVFELMRELKGLGAHNVVKGKNRKTTSKGSMHKMTGFYEEYRIDGLIPATYEILFVSARV